MSRTGKTYFILSDILASLDILVFNVSSTTKTYKLQFDFKNIPSTKGGTPPLPILDNDEALLDKANEMNSF
jgi:methenyltetrahydromethanopterin cyclohydrolase